MRTCLRSCVVLLVAIAIVAIAGPALATHKKQSPGEHLNSHLLFDSPNTSVPQAINSDIAFWGDKAYVGNYDGFRIFDISGTRPKLITDFKCFGPQNDASVYDVDGDGQADVLFLSVDRTLSGPRCGSVAVANDDPTGWEGIRVFDIRDPRNPKYLTAVYH